MRDSESGQVHRPNFTNFGEVSEPHQGSGTNGSAAPSRSSNAGVQWETVQDLHNSSPAAWKNREAQRELAQVISQHSPVAWKKGGACQSKLLCRKLLGHESLAGHLTGGVVMMRPQCQVENNGLAKAQLTYKTTSVTVHPRMTPLQRLHLHFLRSPQVNLNP